MKRNQVTQRLPSPVTEVDTDRFVEQMDQVLDMTGAVPMYLDRFCVVYEAEHSKDGFQLQRAISNFAAELARFIEGDLGQFVSCCKDQRDEFLNLAESILCNGSIANRADLIDHRYFYVSQCRDGMRVAGHGYAVCGVARDALAVLVRHAKGQSPFLSDDWLNACRNMKNPSCQGFMAEQMVISYVESGGLKIGDELFDKPSLAVFFAEACSAALTVDHSCVLYIPKPYNFKYIDFLVRVVSPSPKGSPKAKPDKRKVVIIAAQPTLQSVSKHKTSLGFFYSGAYKSWANDLDPDKFDIEWRFLWIVRKSEHQQHHAQFPRKSSSGGLSFTEYCMSFESVSNKLAFL
jgi:hypothetical protein